MSDCAFRRRLSKQVQRKVNCCARFTKSRIEACAVVCVFILPAPAAAQRCERVDSVVRGGFVAARPDLKGDGVDDART